jgi:hypothetical protein
LGAMEIVPQSPEIPEWFKRKASFSNHSREGELILCVFAFLG